MIRRCEGCGGWLWAGNPCTACAMLDSTHRRPRTTALGTIQVFEDRIHRWRGECYIDLDRCGALHICYDPYEAVRWAESHARIDHQAVPANVVDAPRMAGRRALLRR